MRLSLIIRGTYVVDPKNWAAYEQGAIGGGWILGSIWTIDTSINNFFSENSSDTDLLGWAPDGSALFSEKMNNFYAYNPINQTNAKIESSEIMYPNYPTVYELRFYGSVRTNIIFVLGLTPNGKNVVTFMFTEDGNDLYKTVTGKIDKLSGMDFLEHYLEFLE